MIYFHAPGSYTDLLATITGAGIDVSIPDADMSDEDLYNAVLEADSVVIEHDDSVSDGFIVGLAMAFGKLVYAGPGPAYRGFEFDGYRPFPSLAAAVEAAVADTLEADREYRRLDEQRELDSGRADSESDSGPESAAR